MAERRPALSATPIKPGAAVYDFRCWHCYRVVARVAAGGWTNCGHCKSPVELVVPMEDTDG